MFENFLGKAAEIVGKGAEAVKTGAEKVKEYQENANIISEEYPLKTAGLEIYPNRFKYKNKKYSFNDIKHLNIYWSSTTYNGVINKQEVTIYIHLVNTTLSISKTTMYVTPKLVKAYNYIAYKTFDIRLKGYTEQLAKDGYFILKNATYFYTEDGFLFKKTKSITGDAYIYSDARVKFKDKKLSLFNATINNNSIDIKDIDDKHLEISIGYDKDVIFALVNFIMENPQSPDDYINNQRYQNTQNNINDFLLNSLSLMAKLSYADGVVSPEEIEVVEEFLLKTMDIDRSELSQIMITFNQAKNSPKSFEYFATNLFNNYDEELLSIILDILFLIAIADGTISAEEELLLLEAETIFGIKGTMYSEFKNQSHTKKSNKKEYYLDVLGLEITATQSEIKKAYRRLAMKFHPDRLCHLGEDFLKEAEIKMKDINEAYEYLKNL